MASETYGEMTIDDILASSVVEVLEDEGVDEVVVEDDDDIEIEIVDDTPEEDRVEPRDETRLAASNDFDDESKDEDADDETQVKRIKRVRYEYHEERRAKESADRQTNEAINFAKSMQKENQELKQLIQRGETVLVEEVRARTKADLEYSKKDLESAHEDGDASKIIAAQEKFSTANFDARQAELYIPQESSQQQQNQQNTGVPPVAESPVPQQAPQRDVMFDEWEGRNAWFQTDEAMTQMAIAKHKQLVNSGVDSKSEAYYNSIDDFMVTNFPDKFKVVESKEVEKVEKSESNGERKPAAKSPTTQVAPATRTAGGKRVVQLNESERKVARRLGVSNKLYAHERERLNQGGD